MPAVLFLPNDHLLAWFARLPAEPLPRLVQRINQGQWPIPQEWQEQIHARFELPPGPLALYAEAALPIDAALPSESALLCEAQGELLIIRPLQPLVEKAGGLPLARPLNLSTAQRRLLRLLAQGLTQAEAARQLGRTRRWAVFQLREIRRATRRAGRG